MMHNFSKLANDEAGFVISAELVLVLTIAVLGMVVGLAAVRDSVTNELNDLAHAFGAINQSYSYRGMHKPSQSSDHASVAGSGFNDRGDDCDCNPIVYIDVAGKQDSSQGAANEGNSGHGGHGGY